MRTRALQAFLAIAGLTLFGTQAFAGSGSIQARIPFEFVIGETVLPAADYIIETSGNGPTVLRIRTIDIGERVMFDTIQMPEKDDPKMLGLVFDTVGDKTYLTEVWGVTDSGRSVKHLVDGHQLERAPEASRQHVTALRIVDGRDS